MFTLPALSSKETKGYLALYAGMFKVLTFPESRLPHKEL